MAPVKRNSCSREKKLEVVACFLRMVETLAKQHRTFNHRKQI